VQNIHYTEYPWN